MQLNLSKLKLANWFSVYIQSSYCQQHCSYGPAVAIHQWSGTLCIKLSFLLKILWNDDTLSARVFCSLATCLWYRSLTSCLTQAGTVDFWNPFTTRTMLQKTASHFSVLLVTREFTVEIRCNSLRNWWREYRCHQHVTVHQGTGSAIVTLHTYTRDPIGLGNGICHKKAEGSSH